MSVTTNCQILIPSHGDTFEDTVRLAKSMAEYDNTTVAFDFNNIDVVVDKYSNVETFISIYKTYMLSDDKQVYISLDTDLNTGPNGEPLDFIEIPRYNEMIPIIKNILFAL